MASPPADFKHLAAARSADLGTFVNVIGVVVDLLPTRQTQTGDHMLTFKLLDPKLRDAIYGNDGCKVRFFRKVAVDLPNIQIADVVLLRNIKVGNFANEAMLLAHLSTTHLVFPDARIPKPGFSIGFMGGTKLQCSGTHGLRERLTPEEQSYIIQVKDHMQVEPKAAPAAATSDFPTRALQTAATRQKLKAIKELRHNEYSDLCAQVVKKFPTPHNGQFGCELYVTDYTENDQMFYYRAPEEPTDAWRDGDSFGYNQPSRKDWPGPYGFLVLKIELAHPHSGFAISKLSEGDIVLLQNVRPKLSGGNSRLEANMWMDSINPEKIQIQKITPQQQHSRREVLGLMERRAQYWAGRERAALQQKQAETAAKPTKGEKKKRRKLAKQQAEAQAALAADEKVEKNKHVRCSNEDQTLMPLHSILDETNERHTNDLPDGTTYILPFTNASYRTKVRVVDFDPPGLEDFALLAEPDDDKSEFSQDMSWQSSSLKWEWSFSLQLEEVHAGASKESEPMRLWANVGHLEAQFLLGNGVDDPADLHQNPTLLNKLREKLYILWGDLEEKKKVEGEQVAKRQKLDEPSNRPFDCCLQEYGMLSSGGDVAEIGDWERRFMMFGVTIL